MNSVRLIATSRVKIFINLFIFLMVQIILYVTATTCKAFALILMQSYHPSQNYCLPSNTLFTYFSSHLKLIYRVRAG